MQTIQKVFIQKITSGTINNEFANKKVITDIVNSLRKNEEVSHNIKFLTVSTDKFEYKFGLSKGVIIYSKCVDFTQIRDYVVFKNEKGEFELKWDNVKDVKNPIYSGNDTRENAFSKFIKLIKDEK